MNGREIDTCMRFSGKLKLELDTLCFLNDQIFHVPLPVSHTNGFISISIGIGIDHCPQPSESDVAAFLYHLVNEYIYLCMYVRLSF